MNIHAYASRLGIDLYAEYKAAEAAKKIRVGVNAINAAANDNELPCIRTGKKKRVYLGLDLIKWKLSKRIESASITSRGTVADIGAEHGMTNRPDKGALQRLAQKTFKAQSKS